MNRFSRTIAAAHIVAIGCIVGAVTASGAPQGEQPRGDEERNASKVEKKKKIKFRTQRGSAWQVSIDKDRFGGPAKVIARTQKDNWMLAVRCLHGELSVAMIEATLRQGRFSEGMEINVKFKADNKEVVEAEATGLDDRMFQVNESDEIVRAMRGAREYAFRITYATTTYDRIFPGGADQAIAQVLKECPLAEP
jgi:hypothetical protein